MSQSITKNNSKDRLSRKEVLKTHRKPDSYDHLSELKYKSSHNVSGGGDNNNLTPRKSSILMISDQPTYRVSRPISILIIF